MKEKLTVKWSRRERDHVFHFPRRKCDGALVHWVFTRVVPNRLPSDPPAKSFLEELDARGFDLTTLKFSIEMKATP